MTRCVTFALPTPIFVLAAAAAGALRGDFTLEQVLSAPFPSDHVAYHTAADFLDRHLRGEREPGSSSR